MNKMRESMNAAGKMVLTLLDESPERAVLKPSKRNADSGE